MESDRFRMLLEAIAVARAGQHLTRQGGFFVVAVYLWGKLDCRKICRLQYCIAGGVLFCSSSPLFFSLPHTEARSSLPRKVSTLRRAVAFLCEMYNLLEMLEGLAGNLDRGKSPVAGSWLMHLENFNADLWHRFAFLECIESVQTRSNLFEC